MYFEVFILKLAYFFFTLKFNFNITQCVIFVFHTVIWIDREHLENHFYKGPTSRLPIFRRV